MSLGPHLVRVSGGLKIVLRQLDGAKGTALKSWGTSKTWYAGSWGWVRYVRSIFNDSCACLISLHNSTEVNVLSHVLSTAIVWFLNVCITCSSEFTLWLWGSTGLIIMVSSYRYFWTAFEATFSLMLKNGLNTILVKYVMFYLKVTIMDVYFKSFTGVARIAFTTSCTAQRLLCFLLLIWLGIFRRSQQIWCYFSDLVSHGMQIGDYLYLLWLPGVDLCLSWGFPILFWFSLW